VLRALPRNFPAAIVIVQHVEPLVSSLRLLVQRSLGFLGEAAVDAAFTGNPQDVRSWPTLDPLVSHALVLAKRAD
jgi:hypothetical protein